MMKEATPWLFGAVGVLFLSILILCGIKACENTYQRAFENGYSNCVLPGRDGTYWCKDGKEVK